MRLAHLALACLVVPLCACIDKHVPNATTYVQEDLHRNVPLAFVANSVALTPASEATLQALRYELTDAASLSLVVSGGLASARAQQVGDELGRPVSLAPARLSGSVDAVDPALLSVVIRRVVASDCLAPGQPVARDNWPGDDKFRPRSMPPGCATANSLQQMVVNQEDLQRGRPLPFGAALPAARAIERYYNRSETAPSSTSQASAGLGAGNLTPVKVPAADNAETGGSDAGSDLQQGPLPQGAPVNAANPANPGQ